MAGGVDLAAQRTQVVEAGNAPYEAEHGLSLPMRPAHAAFTPDQPEPNAVAFTTGAADGGSRAVGAADRVTGSPVPQCVVPARACWSEPKTMVSTAIAPIITALSVARAAFVTVPYPSFVLPVRRHAR